ncbi:hypothetical protein [Gillisia sp. CAL575]|uniref:hypothetical protein n=1 Tax=Gillisia sp. CAL575 TaxID=985255 RepID=UPI000557B400|nr:hypothetical protein [Gillisia sp. CAL575]
MQFLFLFIAIFLEGFSVIAGIYYLKKMPNDLSNKLLTYFLLITFTVEITGLIPAIIYHNEALHHLKDTVWYTNFWLFNPYLVVSFAFYCYYFGRSLQSRILKNILNYSVIVFVISSFLILIFSDVLFVSHSYFTLFFGVALLFLAISFYYYELLRDEKLLDIKRSVKFYVSVAFLLFNLISLPLWIYFKYFSNTISPEFVKLYQSIFYLSNVLLYSTYIFAFIYCAQQKQFPVINQNKSVP